MTNLVIPAPDPETAAWDPFRDRIAKNGDSSVVSQTEICKDERVASGNQSTTTARVMEPFKSEVELMVWAIQKAKVSGEIFRPFSCRIVTRTRHLKRVIERITVIGVLGGDTPILHSRPADKHMDSCQITELKAAAYSQIAELANRLADLHAALENMELSNLLQLPNPIGRLNV